MLLVVQVCQDGGIWVQPDGHGCHRFRHCQRHRRGPQEVKSVVSGLDGDGVLSFPVIIFPISSVLFFFYRIYYFIFYICIVCKRN